MKQKIIQLARDPLTARTVKIFVIILVIYTSVTIGKWSRLPPQIPLFYSFPRSSEQLAVSWQLFLLPFFSIFFFSFNFLLAAALFPTEKLASTILVTTGLVVSLIFLITFIKIVFLLA